MSQSLADTDSSIRKGIGCSMSRDINRGAMVKGETVVIHNCIRTENSKISTFDLQQTKHFESSSFSNVQHHYTTLPCENEGTGKQTLLKFSKEIWQSLLKHQITITAECLPSSLMWRQIGSLETAETHLN